MPRRNMSLPVFAALITLTFVLGCDKQKPVAEPTQPDRPTRPLRAAIYQSDEIAEFVNSGWQGIADQPVEAAMFGDDDDLVEIAKTADVLIVPANRLGQMVADGAIAELPESFLTEHADTIGTLYPRLRDSQVRWAGQTYGMSLGSPIATVMVNEQVDLADGSESISYDQFDQMAKDLSGDAPAAAEPLADGQAAITLLRRSAAYSDGSWLFDRGDFHPLIAGEPYLTALTELVEASESFPAEKLSAQQIWQRLISGELKIAVGYPIESESTEDADAISVFPPPFATRIYDGQWREADQTESHECFLPGDGLIVGVSRSSRQTSASRAFCRWLAKDGHDALRRVSDRTSAIRDADETAGGVQRLQSSASISYDELTAKHLTKSVLNHPVRIRGAKRYLAALDEAVIAAIDGDLSPEQALAQAADKWTAISEELGVKDQKRAWAQNRGVQ